LIASLISPAPPTRGRRPYVRRSVIKADAPVLKPEPVPANPVL
jgi:hypothetical protein